jgi:hypothetical protein
MLRIEPSMAGELLNYASEILQKEPRKALQSDGDPGTSRRSQSINQGD